MFLAFLICARPIFSSKKERTFFFGVMPSMLRAGGGTNADEVLQKLFFGERILQNFGSFVFEFGSRKWKRRGLGRNFPFAPLFVLGESGAEFLTTGMKSRRTVYLSSKSSNALRNSPLNNLPSSTYSVNSA